MPIPLFSRRVSARFMPSLVAGAAALLVSASGAGAAKLGGSNLFWTFDGDFAGTCIRMNEPADGAHWQDNGLCGSMLPEGIRWSHQGPVEGLRCVSINEPVDRGTWNDNYLCVPRMAPVQFVFSSAGSPNLTRPAACVPLQEPADPDTWDDNVLCAITLDAFERDLLEASVVDEAPYRARIGALRSRLDDATARIRQLEARLAEEQALREELERRPPTVIIDDPRVVRSPNERRGVVVPNVR